MGDSERNERSIRSPSEGQQGSVGVRAGSVLGRFVKLTGGFDLTTKAHLYNTVLSRRFFKPFHFSLDCLGNLQAQRALAGFGGSEWAKPFLKNLCRDTRATMLFVRKLRCDASRVTTQMVVS